MLVVMRSKASGGELYNQRQESLLRGLKHIERVLVKNLRGVCSELRFEGTRRDSMLLIVL
jgi:hypothetical protein